MRISVYVPIAVAFVGMLSTLAAVLLTQRQLRSTRWDEARLLAYGELLYALEELAEMSNAVVKWARDRGIQKRSGEASIAISEDAKGRELVSRLRLLNDQIKRQGRTVSILSSDGVHDALYRVLYAMHERMGWMLDTMQEALDGEVNLPELEVDELGAKFNDAVGEFYVAVRKELRVK